MTSPPLGKDELQQRLSHSAFIDFLNLMVLSADPEKQEVIMRAAMRPEFERGRGTGQWHGGPIAAIIEGCSPAVARAMRHNPALGIMRLMPISA
jgi:acyl-coenzyme A thioesterase PaaI-like protein